MLITSILFLILFTITITLYAVMFYKVWDKLKGLRHIRSPHHSHSKSESSSGRATNTANNKSTSGDTNAPMSTTTQEKGRDDDESVVTDGKYSVSEKASSLATPNDLDEKAAGDPPRAASAASVLAPADVAFRLHEDTPCHRPAWRNSRHLKRKEHMNEEFPAVLSQSTKDLTPIEYVRSPKATPSRPAPAKASKLSGTESSDNAASSNPGSAAASPRAKNRRKSSKGGGGGTKIRRREIELMTSMFIVIAVFFVTNLPSILFLFYTYFVNDREIKEIGNIILQVGLA